MLEILVLGILYVPFYNEILAGAKTHHHRASIFTQTVLNKESQWPSSVQTSIW